MFRSMVGIDYTTFKCLFVMGWLCVAVLIIYRVWTVIDCMRRNPKEFPADVDRAVWVILSAFVPLGIGAFLYHLVFLNRPRQWFFIVPFLILLLSIVYLMFKLWPSMSKFDFDFIHF